MAIIEVSVYGSSLPPLTQPALFAFAPSKSFELDAQSTVFTQQSASGVPDGPR